MTPWSRAPSGRYSSTSHHHPDPCPPAPPDRDRIQVLPSAEGPGSCWAMGDDFSQRRPQPASPRLLGALDGKVLSTTGWMACTSRKQTRSWNERRWPTAIPSFPPNPKFRESRAMNRLRRSRRGDVIGERSILGSGVHEERSRRARCLKRAFYEPAGVLRLRL